MNIYNCYLCFSVRVQADCSLFRMLQDLTESLGCSVDLVSRDSLEKSFEDEVLNTQVLIYEK